MQIHELLHYKKNLARKPSNQSLDEAAISSYFKALVNKAGSAPGSRYLSRVQTADAERQVQKMFKNTLPAWRQYIFQVEQTITDPQAKQTFQNRTDGKYEQYLTAWIQSNLMRNLYINSVQNAGQINTLVNQLSQANLPPASQEILWKNLIRVVAQSLIAVQQQQQQQNQPQPPNNPQGIAAMLAQLFGPAPDKSKIVSALVQLNNGSTRFQSTGNNLIDGLLISLGLTVL